MRVVARLILLPLLFSLALVLPGMAAANQQKVLIGILPEMNVFKQKQRFQHLGDYLSHKVGTRVEFTILSRYGNIIEHFTTDKMDGAFFGSFTGALAIRKLGVVPLARPVDQSGASTYHGYIFVRKDSRIKGAKDMRNRKMVFVDKTTTAGYLFPVAYLKENGVRDTDHFFSSTFFSGSHDAAIHAVLDGKADVGAAKHSIYDHLRKQDPRIDRELTILSRSDNMPSNGLCVRKDLDEGLKRKLKQALLSMNEDTEGKKVLQRFGASGFIDTGIRDYEPVFRMAARAGVDLATYDNRNR